MTAPLDPALPAASLLLDEGAARALVEAALGRPTGKLRTTFVRHKLRRSLLVSYRTEDGGIVSAKAFAEPQDALDLARRLGDPVRLDPSARVVVLPFPVDPGLRRLGEVLDIRRLRRLLQAALGREVKRRGLRVRVVRYKPERRCLCEVRTGDGTRVFVRVIDRERAARLVARLGPLRAAAAGIHLPLPLACDAERGALVEPALPGCAFTHLARYSASRRRRLVVALARGLIAIHRTAVPGLPAERPSDVLARVERALDALVLHAPRLAGRCRRLMRSVRRRADRLIGAPRSPLHGDLDPSQVLVARNTVTLLDFERSVLGDPASDVGHFVAGLLALGRAGRLPGRLAEELSARFVRAYRQGAPGTLARRRLAWHLAAGLAERALDLVRLPTAGAESLARRLLEEALGHVRGTALTPGMGERVGTSPLPATGIGPALVGRVARLREPCALAMLADQLLPEAAPWKLGEPRIWPKPGGRFVLLAPRQGETGPHFLTAYLFPEASALPSPRPGTGARHPDQALLLQAFPHDFRLKGLRRLASEAGAGAAVAPARARSVRVLGYWPGKRALLLVETASGPLYLKVFREAHSVTEGKAALAALASLPGVSVPRLHQAGEDPPFLVTKPLPGAPLDLARRPPEAEELAAAGAALACLHRTRFDPGRRFGAKDELAVTGSWVAVAVEIRPDLAHPLGQLWSRLAARPCPPGGQALLHRDFHDRQVVLAPGGGVGLLDLDTLALGDPALDLGNFAAHLRLRALERGDGDGAGAAADHFFAGYALAAPLPGHDRRIFYTATALVRLAAVYSLRPARRDLSPALARAAAATLSGDDR